MERGLAVVLGVSLVCWSVLVLFVHDPETLRSISLLIAAQAAAGLIFAWLATARYEEDNEP